MKMKKKGLKMKKLLNLTTLSKTDLKTVTGGREEGGACNGTYTSCGENNGNYVFDQINYVQASTPAPIVVGTNPRR